nr:MAG TPA: hypothetical protein [Caudoviricetes sp.]
MRASAEDITAMKERLRARQEQRWLDESAAEVMRMVHHRAPLGEQRVAGRMPQIVEERATPLEKREYVARLIPAERAFSWAAVALILARSVIDNWLFLLVLGFVVFGAVAVC